MVLLLSLSLIHVCGFCCEAAGTQCNTTPCRNSAACVCVCVRARGVAMNDCVDLHNWSQTPAIQWVFDWNSECVLVRMLRCVSASFELILLFFFFFLERKRWDEIRDLVRWEASDWIDTPRLGGGGRVRVRVSVWARARHHASGLYSLQFTLQSKPQNRHIET